MATSSGSHVSGAYPKGFPEAALSKIAHGHEEVLQLLQQYANAADPLAQKEAIEGLAAYVLSPSKLARVLDLALLERIYEIFRSHHVDEQEKSGTAEKRPSLDGPLFGDLESALETRKKELVLLRRYYAPTSPSPPKVLPGGMKNVKKEYVLPDEASPLNFSPSSKNKMNPKSSSPSLGLAKDRSVSPKGRLGPVTGLGSKQQQGLPLEMKVSGLKSRGDTWGSEHAAIRINHPSTKQYAPVYYVPTRSGANNYVKNPREPKPHHVTTMKHSNSRPGGFPLGGAANKSPSSSSLVPHHSSKSSPSPKRPHNANAHSAVAAMGMMDTLQVSQMSNDGVKVAEAYPLASSSQLDQVDGKHKSLTTLKPRHSQPGKYTLLYREEELARAHQQGKVSNIPQDADANQYSLGTLAAHFNEDTTRWLVEQGFTKQKAPGAASASGGAAAGGGQQQQHATGTNEEEGAPTATTAGKNKKFDIFQDTVDLMLAATAATEKSAAELVLNNSPPLAASASTAGNKSGKK